MFKSSLKCMHKGDDSKHQALLEDTSVHSLNIESDSPTPLQLGASSAFCKCWDGLLFVYPITRLYLHIVPSIHGFLAAGLHFQLLPSLVALIHSPKIPHPVSAQFRCSNLYFHPFPSPCP